MDCDVCNRSHDTKRLPFLCAVDARNHIYEGRIKNLHLLIENEGLQKQISDLLVDTTVPSKDRKDSLQAQQRMAEDRTTQILAAADKLRNDIKAAREEIKAKKAALSRRRSDIAAVSNGLMERRVKQQKEVERATNMSKYRWSQTAEDMSRTRSFLCMEAARLCGLKRVNKPSPNQYEYHLGGLPVVDLTSMNCESWLTLPSIPLLTSLSAITRSHLNFTGPRISHTHAHLSLSRSSPSCSHHPPSP